jgi:hypothetical protein
VGITLTDTAIAAMNKQLALLIASDVTAGVDGFALRPVDGRGALAAGATNGPPVLVRDNMLVTFTHVNLLTFLAYRRSYLGC